ncbi:MAG: flagellar hook-basal body complex protein FliE [Eubacterium sp.]|nr:flagellar hook-basal body complex protein FliE [Eubacterium sp.]
MNITNISAIKGLESVSRYETSNPIAPTTRAEKASSFDALLSDAMGLIKETNDYSNKSEEEKIKFATGESDNLHDLMIAQQKATVSLQYTAAVKNTVVEAYKTIMNMQF